MVLPLVRARFARSIASRTVLVMTLALAGVVCLLVVGAGLYIFGKADAALARRADAILRVVSASAASPLWNLDKRDAAAMLDGLASEPEAVWAEIRDERGDAFATYGPVQSDPAAMVLSTPVHIERGGAARTIGTLRIAFTAARARAAAWREVAALAAAGLLATIVMAACLARLMRRFTVPLGELTAVMNALQRGQFDGAMVPATGRTDELGAMARSLDGTLAELRSLNGELLARNDRFDAALNTMAQGLCMLDADQRVIVCNQRFLDLFGLDERDAAPGRPWREVMIRIDELGGFPAANLLGIVDPIDAAIAWTEASSFPHVLPDGRSIAISHRPTANSGVVSTYEDVSERQRAEARIAHMARHDALTDLPNRNLFRERLDDSLRQIGRRDESLAVLCLDLDRFKAVNDTLGHPIGDALLRAVADRLRDCVRDNDAIARLGGDEFVVVQVGPDQPQNATVLAERIIERLSAPYDLDGHQVVIGTSVGVAISPSDSDDPDQLLKAADMALYRAKMDGRGIVRFFEAEMDAKMQARRALELDLRKALPSGEFEVHYQPVISLESNKVSGFEALLRWTHPERGRVSPADFIPLAEEIGLINQIGAWVLMQACADAMTWPDDVRVAVNLSPAQFKRRTLVLDVVSALASSGLPARRLELEITETVMLQDTEATLTTLHQLRGFGVRISMDDFGTGYSSLSYLRKFPFDKIKIDQSFIRDLPDGKDAVAIVRAVAGLGTSLGMSTTAEGVETAGQLEKLRAEGCTEVQGWLFSPARPASEVAGLLSSVADRFRPAA